MPSSEKVMSLVPGPKALLASVCDFGWGSLGKLRLILDRMPPTDVILFGGSPLNSTIVEMLSEKHKFSQNPTIVPDAALVINDPVAANGIAASGIPVVYVDSLPYLWSLPQEVPEPQHVAIYCAQKYPSERMPVSDVLKHRANIQWVDPIVPPTTRRRGGEGIVLNVGGLHSHRAGNAPSSYLALVLEPVLKELSVLGNRIFAVCGNIPENYCRTIQEKFGIRGTVGIHSPYSFESILKDADILITSPGSTTILQAIRLRLPTLLLPPQNLSQVLNTKLFSLPGSRAISWPSGIMSMNRVEKLRPQGEDAVLSYMYGCISTAARNPESVLSVARGIRATVRCMPTEGILDPSMSTLGWNGAEQVSRRVRQVLLAPSLPPAGAPTSN